MYVSNQVVIPIDITPITLAVEIGSLLTWNIGVIVITSTLQGLVISNMSNESVVALGSRNPDILL